MEILFFTTWMALIAIVPVIAMTMIGLLAVDLITIIYEKVKSKKSEDL